MSRTKLFSDLILLLGALIWGMAFVAQSVGADSVETHTFNFARYLLAALFLFVCLLVTNRHFFKDLKENQQQTSLTVKGGIQCGIFLFAASAFQQMGLKYTDASKAGFLTTLYIVTTPLLGLFLGKKITKKTALAVVVSLLGVCLLSLTEAYTIEQGDLYLIGCAAAFAFQIQSVDKYCKQSDPLFLNMVQFATACIISLVFMLLFEEPSLSAVRGAWLPIFYAGVISGGIGYTLQIIGQKGTDPASGALIMSLESVFAALGGFLILHETMTVRELAGSALMFTAVIITALPEKSAEKADIDT